MNRNLHVYRDGVGLGAWPEEEAMELLRLGFLQATDTALVDGAGAAMQLGEFNGAVPEGVAKASRPAPSRPPATPTPDGPWDRPFRVAGAALGRLAGRLAPQLRRLGATGSDLTTDTRRLLEGALPQIRARVRQVLESSAVRDARASLDNEAALRRLFSAVYVLLPGPFCRFVPESVFVEFCLRNRERLIEKRSD